MNTGQPNQPVERCQSITATMLTRLFIFLEKNSGHSFNQDSDLLWLHLNDFKQTELISAIKGKGVTEDDIYIFSAYIQNTRHWVLPLGSKVKLDDSDGQPLKLLSEEEYDHYYRNIDKDNENNISLTTSKIKQLLRILNSSSDKEAAKLHSDIFEQSKEYLNDGHLIQDVPNVAWKECEAGYQCRITNKYSPVIDVLRRWDSEVQGFNISLVRSCAGDSSTLELYLDLDSKGELLAADLFTVDEANITLMKVLSKRFPTEQRFNVINTEQAISDSTTITKGLREETINI